MGKRSTVPDLPQGYVREFDLNDRVTTLACPSMHEILYSYDALGRRTSMTDPDGNVTEYHYSNTANDKKLAYIEHPFSGRTNYFYSQDKGLLTEESYDTFHLMLGTAWTYDAMNRVSSFEVVNSDTSAIYHREAYTYNANSMRTRVDYQVAGQPNYHRLYSYDPVLRLTEQHKRWDANNATAWRYAYEYDPTGNRTQMVHFDGSTTRTVTSSYNDGNQLTQNSDGSYVFDDNGNMVEHNLGSYSKHYRHDRENRLVQFEDEDSSTVVDYVYDTAGLRILREENGNKLLYFFDGLNVLMIKEKPAGCTTWRTKNVYTLKQAGIGQIVSEREYGSGGGCSVTPTGYLDRWYQFDLLGNTVCTTLAGGGVETQPETEAFGSIIRGDGARYHLTTKSYDEVADLYYFAARWMRPGSGGLLEPDPVRAMNLYCFVDANPVLKIDVDGRLPLQVCCEPITVFGMPRFHCWAQDGPTDKRGMGLVPTPEQSVPCPNGSCGLGRQVRCSRQHGPSGECKDAGCPPGVKDRLWACLEVKCEGRWWFSHNCNGTLNECLAESGCSSRVSSIDGVAPRMPPELPVWAQPPYPVWQP